MTPRFSLSPFPALSSQNCRISSLRAWGGHTRIKTNSRCFEVSRHTWNLFIPFLPLFIPEQDPCWAPPVPNWRLDKKISEMNLGWARTGKTFFFLWFLKKICAKKAVRSQSSPRCSGGVGRRGKTHIWFCCRLGRAQRPEGWPPAAQPAGHSWKSQKWSEVTVSLKLGIKTFSPVNAEAAEIKDQLWMCCRIYQIIQHFYIPQGKVMLCQYLR